MKKVYIFEVFDRLNDKTCPVLVSGNLALI